MQKRITYIQEDDIAISRASELLTELNFGEIRILLDQDGIYDLTYRLASYLAYLESLPTENESEIDIH